MEPDVVHSSADLVMSSSLYTANAELLGLRPPAAARLCVSFCVLGLGDSSLGLLASSVQGDCQAWDFFSLFAA